MIWVEIVGEVLSCWSLKASTATDSSHVRRLLAQQHQGNLCFWDNDWFILWKIAFFPLLCPSLADWSRQASIKPKKNYESKHTDVPSWSGSSALLQLQSARRYDDRAADRACLRQITAHPQDTQPSHAFFWKLGAPAALPKHPSHRKNKGIRWSHSLLLWLLCFDGWHVQWWSFGWRAISSSAR